MTCTLSGSELEKVERSPGAPEGPRNRRTTKLSTSIHQKSWQVNLRPAAGTEWVLPTPLVSEQKGPTVKAEREQQSCSNVILKVTHQGSHPEMTQHVEKRTIKMRERQGPNKSRSGKENLEISESKLHVLKHFTKQWESSVKLGKLLWTIFPPQRSGKLISCKNVQEKNTKVKPSTK